MRVAQRQTTTLRQRIRPFNLQTKLSRLALKAVARVAGIKISEATRSVRKNPLLNEEIHIEQELINLEETFKSYHTAVDSLYKYPDMQKHMLRERRAILEHCVGLVSRMLRGWRLPREYSVRDTRYAVRKLVRIIVEDARKTGYQLEDDMIEVMKPFMSKRQVLQQHEWLVEPVQRLKSAAKPAYRKLANTIPFL